MTGWRFVQTKPLSGSENMAYDVRTLRQVHDGSSGPTLRFFRWITPTVSYGRLQQKEKLNSVIPAGWDSVQRPTGGGIVLHDSDLCVSLTWAQGTPPMPEHLQDHYAWIHRVIQRALPTRLHSTLATCDDCSSTKASFHLRNCFNEPVADDILVNETKIVGGALARQHRVFLYQGSIQHPSTNLEKSLYASFGQALGGFISDASSEDHA